MIGTDKDEGKEIKRYSISIMNNSRKCTLKSFTFFLIIVSIAGGAGYYQGKKVVSERLYDKLEDKSENIDLRDTINNAVEKVRPSIVTISSSKESLLDSKHEGNITGAIVSSDGYIISNYSKIKDFNEIYVKLDGIEKELIKAVYIGGEEKTDVGLIKIDKKDLNALDISDETEVNESDLVFAIGSTTSEHLIGKAAPGMITSKNYLIQDSFGNESHKVIQYNAIVNRYNTGGVLVNEEGELLGILSMHLSESFNTDGLNYSVVGSCIKSLLKQIISSIDLLGVNGSNVVIENKIGVEGIYIRSVEPNKAADRAGLLPTDIILSIDGQKVNKIEDIYSSINNNNNNNSGDTIQCNILRDGVETIFYIKL